MLVSHTKSHSKGWAVFRCLMLLSMVGKTSGRPNIIIMQPDDFEYLAKWDPPAHFPGRTGVSLPALLPNIQRLRENGAIMTRAYTASPQCGTSRYSTLTGRYPSRSAYSRARGQDPLSVVTIATTKLIDIDGSNDCSEDNLAALMKTNGYRTGFMGKWHLGEGSARGGPATYPEERATIQACGFDTAEAIHWENLADENNLYLHNMEHMVDEAIQFIDSTAGEEFLMYFNPTAPHGSGSVLESLLDFTCQDAPEGVLESEPIIPGMTAGIGCAAYRQTILDRAQGDVSNNVLGSIWVDDAVGALLQHLESVGQLENTLFLFQLDHGQEGKASLYEPGIRTAQFVYYPNQIPAGTVFSGLVSTIDIAPSVADYAGITSSSPGVYDMDGTSWKSWLEQPNTVNDRCLVAEIDLDRAVVCSCEKVLQIGDTEISRTFRSSERFGLVDGGNIQLCDDKCYITGPNESPETANVPDSGGMLFDRLDALLECHTEMTRPTQSVYGSCKEIEMGETMNLPNGNECQAQPQPPPSPAPEPTRAPRVRPTTLPVDSTSGPIVEPTQTPRMGPTAVPVDLPDSPIAERTRTPRVRPTAVPVELPNSPTVEPTLTPRVRPTALPPSIIQSLDLVAAGGGGVSAILVQNIAQDAVIRLDSTGSDLSIIANIDPSAPVSYVSFMYDGGEWWEGKKPYTMAGDWNGENNSVDYLSTPGPKFVTIRAHDSLMDVLETVSYTFMVA